MAISRRVFLSGSAAALGAPAIVVRDRRRRNIMPTAPAGRLCRRAAPRAVRGYDPAIDVYVEAIHHNVAEVARICSGRPILAVVKNNGYGLGLANVGPILDALDAVSGLAVVKPDQAIALRDAGVRKPILLMGLFSEQDAEELVARGIRLAPYTDGVHRVLGRLAAKLNREIPVHLYLDTGMNRVGVPYRKAVPWIEAIANEPGIRIEGAFTCFTEEDFDSEQLRRLLDVTSTAQRRGADLGHLHAASSHGVFFRPNAHLDLVRPGLALFGAYPAGGMATNLANLSPAFRLTLGLSEWNGSNRATA